jgi:CRP/FNR family transcriptional regulator, cyclic AMP receptor protein
VARGIPSEVVRHFKSVPLFSGVSPKGLRALVAAATEIDVKPGKVLVREGGFDSDLFVIISGTAEVSRGSRRLRAMGEGDFFGEMALLNRAPRSATVTATSPMTVMVLGWRELEGILQEEPGLMRPILSALAERVRANDPRSATH